MSCIRTPGEKSTPHRDLADPPRRRANKRKGKGNYENDRPPILSLISRTSHEVRYWVLEHAGYPLGEADHAHDHRKKCAAREYNPVYR
jgi:hypothetical protein